MARIIMTLLGMGLLALGIWLGYQWWPELLIGLKAIAILFAVLAGLFIAILGISEIAGSRAAKSALSSSNKEAQGE